MGTVASVARGAQVAEHSSSGESFIKTGRPRGCDLGARVDPERGVSPAGPWGLRPGTWGFQSVDTLSRDTNLGHWPLPVDRQAARGSARPLWGCHPSGLGGWSLKPGQVTCPWHSRPWGAHVHPGSVPPAPGSAGPHWDVVVGTSHRHCQLKGTRREDFSAPCLAGFPGRWRERLPERYQQDWAFGEIPARLGMWGSGQKTGHPGRWPEERRQNLRGERPGVLHGSVVSAFIKCRLGKLRAEALGASPGLSPALRKPGTEDRPSDPETCAVERQRPSLPGT